MTTLRRLVLGAVPLVAMTGCGSSAPSPTATPPPVAVTQAPVAPDCSQPYTASPSTGGIVGTTSTTGVDGRQPLAGASVGLFTTHQSSPQATTASDANGNFSFITAPGQYIVAIIVGPGHGNPEPVTVTVGASCTTTVTLLVDDAPGAPNTTPVPTTAPATASASASAATATASTTP